MNMVTHVTAKNQFPFQIDQTKRSEVIQIKAIETLYEIRVNWQIQDDLQRRKAIDGDG